MNIIDHEQGTEEWLAARRGVPTASRFDRIITAKTGKVSAQASAYIAELIAQTIIEPEPMEPTEAMQHGIETEAAARAWYEFETGQAVQQVGLCMDDGGRFGASPDGLIEPEGGLEIKCPQPATHTGYLLAKGLPDKYKPQVHGSLVVTGRAWWDFVSYCPGLPPLLVRVERDEYTAKVAEALDVFWGAYQMELAKFKELSA